MKNVLYVFSLAVMMISITAGAQEWDRTKYPDYNPNFRNPDPALIKYGKANTAKKAKAMATKEELPDHWDNADTKYFPPVFNQSGGSCGSASRIGYMFTHEINSYRDIDGSTPDHYYPTHFVWLLTNGNSGKDDFVQHIGVPSAKTYGGRTYSELFGYQEEVNSDFGWMTGYDKWFEAMHNRMTAPTSVPYDLGTEEGKLAAKAWLYNHAGDKDFKAGGLIGLGVASGGNWQRIPKTAANDAAGVTNMYYVRAWGQSVDHAVTMVGYDDRIEFDLDGDGIIGETGPDAANGDEVGAWIIVNSWGAWCNNGFIYCPYSNAGPTSDKETWKLKGGYWYGELYHTRKDFRPLRTIKLNMRYSRRSEMLLQVGVSANLNATAPEQIIDMHHFRYAGDGRNGDSIPAPAVPMLGKWADGKLHNEAMEFGYDLTDLTAKFDRNQPLKYFFIINTKAGASGVGRIVNASIIDYEYDTEGVETPFDMGSDGYVTIVKDKSQVGKTIISTIVYGACYNKVQNLVCGNGKLKWDAPVASSHTVSSYNIYKEGSKIGNTTNREYALESNDMATYAVSVLYADGVESAQTTVVTPIVKPTSNVCVSLDKEGFSIPNVFGSRYDQCTIEYWIYPTEFQNWNNAAGPGWGTWLQHFGSDGKMSVGWNTTNGNRITSSSAFTLNEWQLVSIVVNKNKITLYRNGAQVATCTSSNYSGMGGFGNLVFSASASNNYHQQAKYDEVRIWNVARTATQIKGGLTRCNAEFYGNVMPTGLIAYYKGDTFEKDGTWYMRDCVGGNHAELLTAGDVQEQSALELTTTGVTATLKINKPSEVRVGTPIELSATRSDAINAISWDVPAVGMEGVNAETVTATFMKEGEQTVKVKGTSYDGSEVSDELTITVLPATTLDATFKATATTVPSGERVSFIPNSYQSGCQYHWDMPGADVESVDATCAATSYSETGTYTVTLTVTGLDGTSVSSSQDITIEAVAPLASLTVDKSVLLKGESVELASTSKYGPTSYQWIIQGKQKTTIVSNAPSQYVFTPELSGFYNVTLKAANAVGSNKVTVEKAFVVANADSKNGLTFASSNSGTTGYVTFNEQIVPEGQGVFAIEFWANPSKVATKCWGIGQDTNTFQAYVDDQACMHVWVGGKEAKSESGYIIPGEWHHYAFNHSSTGVITFFRDAQQVGSATSADATGKTMPKCTFSLGTSDAPMNGSIDELRVWIYNMNAARLAITSNVPATDESVTKQSWNTNKLIHYYDFNQSGGDVEDRVGSVNGVRHNFGPDGDAWGLSRGVFTLDFGQSGTPTDVTSTYLTNYKERFAYVSNSFVNTTVANRFRTIKDWTLENTNTVDGITAGAHVDTQKNYDFTVTTGWDNFPALTNHKAFQTVELPAGIYTLSCTFGQHGAAGSSFLVAAEGNTLPDVSDLEAKALGYGALSDKTCTFLVTEKMPVSLGVVTTMSGSNIFTISSFKLEQLPVDVVDGGITAIETLSTTMPQAVKGVFTISGVKVRNSAQTEGLPAGLYIVNGKKIIVK